MFHFNSVNRSTGGQREFLIESPGTVGRRHPRELSGRPLPVPGPEL
jgi:hypothetical protein